MKILKLKHFEDSKSVRVNVSIYDSLFPVFKFKTYNLYAIVAFIPFIYNMCQKMFCNTLIFCGTELNDQARSVYVVA